MSANVSSIDKDISYSISAGRSFKCYWEVKRLCCGNILGSFQILLLHSKIKHELVLHLNEL